MSVVILPNISRQNYLIGHSAVENCVRRCTEGGGHIALNSAREMLFCGVPPSGPDRISPQISKDIFIKLRARGFTYLKRDYVISLIRNFANL